MRIPKRWLAVMAVAALLGIGGVAYATIPNSGVIHGCYTRSGGSLRVIDASVTTCKSTETALDWNVQGAIGPQGPQGVQGPAGPTGAQGPAGVSGYQIVSVEISSLAPDDLALFDPVYGTTPLNCPAGKKALGGGVTSTSSTSQGPRLEYSGPTSDGTGWEARLLNSSAFTLDITGYVICATVGS
jgi:hypothetical protein